MRSKYEQIIPGVLQNPIISPAIYRTRDGLSHYHFQYLKVNNYFEIDIIQQPPYGIRNSNMSVAHWLNSVRGGKKICISLGKEPITLEAARNISMEWAELTNEYIKTGRTIDEQIAARN
ncbi:MAG: hypothetical protein KA536_15775 [Saprospiraceae bacterium]|nr:hypothetical protein [Saprospiraceae bacterium]